MFITIVIAVTAAFAAVTGLASRRRGGGIPVRDRTQPHGDLLAGRSLPREEPGER
jgi:hypothetical protein